MEPTNVDRMLRIIEDRHSERAPFDPSWTVTKDELANLVEAARWAPTAHNMQNFRLIVIDDPPLLHQLGELRATISPTFIVESYRQLSATLEALAARGTGLLGTMFPAAWQTGDLAKAPKDATRVLGEVIAGAPMVIVVIFDPTQRAPASEGDVLGMMSLGCVLENMWLAATVQHLDCQVISAFGGAEIEHDVRRVLGIPAPWRIAFTLRLGHAVQAAVTPRVRRAPAAFVRHNRFGCSS